MRTRASSRASKTGLAGHTEDPADGAGRPRGRSWMWPAGVLLLGVFGAFYIVQPLRNGPNMVDEGLLVGVLDSLAQGKSLHTEVLDLYGPAHWAPQTWAYRAAGQRLLGARYYLLALKLVGLVLGTALVLRLAGRGAAIMAWAWLTLLLGVPWQLLQAPYPFLQAWVLALVAYHLLLLGGARRRPWVASVAGVLCGLTITTKVNTGLLLLAGGLFVLSFGTSTSTSTSSAKEPAGLGRPRWLGHMGIALFAGTLAMAIGAHLDIGYLTHLLLPVGLGALWTWRGIETGALQTRVGPPAVYGASALVTACMVLAATFGPAGSLDYVVEQARIIGVLNYARPMAAPGAVGTFVGFSERYWPQLGWLASAIFALWAWRMRPRPGVALPDGHKAIVGLWMLVSCHGFVIYSRPDESHIYQALLCTIPMFFVVASACSTALEPQRNAPTARVLRGGLAALTLMMVPSLWVTPDTYVLTTYPTPWRSPHLAGIDLRAQDNPYVRPAFFSDRRWVDHRADEAARWLHDQAKPGDVVLVATYDELFAFNAGVRAAGGRNRYLFYLLKNGFIDRAGFDLLAPGLLQRLIDHPPDWLIGLPGPFPMPLLKAVPEFAQARKTRYMPATLRGHVQLHRRVK